MTANLIQDFVKIMSRLANLKEEDIDYEGEVLYNEFSNVPSTKQKLKLTPERRKVVKAVRRSSKKPSRSEATHLTSQSSPITIEFGNSVFEKILNSLMEEYCNELIDFVVTRNRKAFYENANKTQNQEEKDETNVAKGFIVPTVKKEPISFEQFPNDSVESMIKFEPEIENSPTDTSTLPDFEESETFQETKKQFVKPAAVILDFLDHPIKSEKLATISESNARENVLKTQDESKYPTETNHSFDETMVKSVVKDSQSYDLNVVPPKSEKAFKLERQDVYFKKLNAGSPSSKNDMPKVHIDTVSQPIQEIHDVDMEQDESFIELDTPKHGAEAIRAMINEVLKETGINDRCRMTVDKIDRINEAIVDTAKHVRDIALLNKTVDKQVQSSVKQLTEQQQVLRNVVEDIRKATEIGQKVTRLKNDQQKVDPNDIEWAKLQAQIQSTQMEHELKIHQIQSSIAIAEINAKGQAHNVNMQYDLGLGKLKMDEWKTQLQTTIQRETQHDNHEHQLHLVKLQAEIDNEKQKQNDWYTALENERDRVFRRELQEQKDNQLAKMNFLDKQFQQFQELERQRHETNLKERWEQFTFGLQKLKDDHIVLLETRKQEFARQIETDRKKYEFDLLKIKEELGRERDERKYTEDARSQERQFMFQQQVERDKMLYSIDMNRIKQEFAEKIQKSKEESEREMAERKQLFTKELEEKRLASTALIASQKENIEKYKADLMAQVKTRQIEKQDENEKLKIQMKLAEYELKTRESDSKVNVNKYQFRVVPIPISAFEFQMERSAETVPHNVVRSFEQLWNTQYEMNTELTRVLKYKSELISSAKKALENFPAFATYVTQDLSKHLIQSRLAYCRSFQRQGMFLFKTSPSFTFTKRRLEDRHIHLLEQRLDLDTDIPEFTYPRYRVDEEGLFIIDALEFMTRELVFPSNSEYNLDISSGEKILFRDRVVLCPEVIRNIFYNIPLEKSRESFRPAVDNSLLVALPRRSSPIYICDNRILLPDLRKRGVRHQTRVQIFS